MYHCFVKVICLFFIDKNYILPTYIYDNIIVYIIIYIFLIGKTFKAHKLILAACSKHFQEIFETTPLGSSLIVILDGTSSTNMASLLEFMYRGEVQISQERLSSFLKTADNLQVKII